jgi:hypothetical protein
MRKKYILKYWKKCFQNILILLLVFFLEPPIYFSETIKCILYLKNLVTLINYLEVLHYNLFILAQKFKSKPMLKHMLFKHDES